jgi:hypothetical protein
MCCWIKYVSCPSNLHKFINLSVCFFFFLSLLWKYIWCFTARLYPLLAFFS